MPATISSGPKCSTIRSAIGKRSGSRMWKACPHAKAVPGVRVAYTDEREIQHAMDLGALVLVVPTVRSVEEGKAARDWTYFPPLRQAQPVAAGRLPSIPRCGAVSRVGIATTINNNVVLVEMIETLDGAVAAREIRFASRRDRDLCRQRRFGAMFSGIQTGHALITSGSSTSCTMRHWRRASGCAARSPGATEPDFTCFQNQSETALARSRAEWPRNWVR